MMLDTGGAIVLMEVSLVYTHNSFLEEASWMLSLKAFMCVSCKSLKVCLARHSI